MTQSLSDSALQADHPKIPVTPLAEYLERFDQLAKNDVCPGPRYNIPYTVIGSGSPVYIVQGICSTRRLYASLAVELSKDFRVVVYELAGIATGDGANMSKYSLEDYVLDLFHLADHLGDLRFPVMGNSFGTTIVVRAMREWPERISRAILAGGFAHRPMTRMERLHLRLLRRWPGMLGNMPPVNWITRYNHARELEFREPGLFDFLIEEHRKIKISTAAAQVQAVDRTDVRALLPHIHQPVMVVHGNEDRLVNPRHASELVDLLPNVQIMLVPRCGHMPHMSHPELLAKAANMMFTTNVTSACHSDEACGEKEPPGDDAKETKQGTI